MKMKEYFRRYKRYALFLFNYIFRERLFGLDFTMRDKRLMMETGGKLHGYSITPRKHLDEIFKCLPIQNTDRFIDIGCGKGFVLWQASARGFETVMGIDIDERLIRIANTNIEKLKLKNVRAVCTDAVKFDAYCEYNYYFFCNPFGIEIFKLVFDNVIRSTQGNGKVTVIYYHPTCADYIESTGRFALRHKIYDPMKDYYTYIYESK